MRVLGHVQAYADERFNRNNEDSRMINLKGYDDIVGFLSCFQFVGGEIF